MGMKLEDGFYRSVFFKQIAFTDKTGEGKKFADGWIAKTIAEYGHAETLMRMWDIYDENSN